MERPRTLELGVRAAIYTRVSTQDQNAEMQRRALIDYCEARGWAYQVFTETASGAASRDVLNEVIREACEGRFDVVVVWKLDRFGRSLIECCHSIGQLESAGVRFIATTQSIDTGERGDSAAKFTLHVLAAASEYERELIRERSLAGLIRYRADYARGRAKSRSGKNQAIGRPPRVLDVAQVAALREKGCSWSQIAKRLGVSERTCRRRLLCAIENGAAPKRLRESPLSCL